MALIGLDEAKSHLQMDHDLDDDEIERKLSEAQEIVLDYLKLPSDSYTDTAGDPVNVPPVVISAVKLVLGALYENREGNLDGPQPLSQAVKDLLHRLRDPAMA